MGSVLSVSYRDLFISPPEICQDRLGELDHDGGTAHNAISHGIGPGCFFLYNGLGIICRVREKSHSKTSFAI